MNQSDILTQDRQKYFNLLDSVRETCARLNDGITKLDRVSTQVINGYSIDGESADHGHLQQVANEARDLHQQLANTVIPAIERKINNLTSDISDALIKEELEAKEKKKND